LRCRRARLEGLELDPAAVALTQRYVAGDLTSDELLKEMIRHPL
jgi:Antitoxin VbhA